MRAPQKSYSIIGLLLLLTAGLTVAVTPNKKIAEERPDINLDAMIPELFGDWSMDHANLPEIAVGADPEQVADRIYNQVLMRTYVNSQGERIMLTIAYGSDQGDSLQPHRPEVCYKFQGFQVSETQEAVINLGKDKLPVMRLRAVSGSRYEPITYWFIVGKRPVTGRVQRKLEQLKYGLTGKIPDGMLVRISSLSRDQDRAYVVHENFVNELYKAMAQEDADRLVGQLTK